MTSPITHIVLFRVPDRDRIDELERLLTEMRDYDGVERLQIKRDLGLHPPAYQLLLISTHADAAALAAFRTDPRHLRLVERLVGLSDARVSLDVSWDEPDEMG